MASKYGKEVHVAETNWPSNCPNPKYKFPSDTSFIPISAAGQYVWLQEVAKRIAAVAGGKGTGIHYWEPMWMDNAGLGSSCDWNVMVKSNGQVMEGMGAFKVI